MEELLLGLLALLLVGVLLAVPVLLIVVLVRTSRLGKLAERVQRLEGQLEAMRSGAPPALTEPAVVSAVADALAEGGQDASNPFVTAAVVAEPASPAFSWEQAIGRKALGWAAVVVLLFAGGFFLRYAFQNQWIGPLGRVALGIIGGIGLNVAGWRQHRRGWRVVSQMLTAAGVVLLYLSAFSAFGFYHLLEQREAAAFLVVIVVESAVLALIYNAPAIAWMAVGGGLLVPLLMHSERDQYSQLFIYLGVLNAAVAWMLSRRTWMGIGTLAVLGTQGLFWIWHAGNYHPEKLGWALGFQAALFGIHVGHGLLVNLARQRRGTWEEVARMLLVALFWFVAAYVLLKEDYRLWLGSLAVGMAAVYALLARMAFGNPADRGRMLLTSVAIATGFMALAFPLEARAEWIAVGWAAQAGVLWWFGQRVSAAPMRGMAAIIAMLAVVRLVIFDTPQRPREPFLLIFNDYALPALAVTGCLAAALVATRSYVPRLAAAERALVALAGVGCVLLGWWVVSVDLYGFFTAADMGYDVDARRLAQMSLSAWWSIYATAVLAMGFRARVALLRWTALGLYAITVGKVFLYDIAGLDAIYRIVAFFVLAVLLGGATWAYQRMQPDRPAAGKV